MFDPITSYIIQNPILYTYEKIKFIRNLIDAFMQIECNVFMLMLRPGVDY